MRLACTYILCLHFVCQKEKAGHEILVKLTASVNFTNILQRALLHESVWYSFSLLKVWLCNIFGERILAQKLLLKCW